MQIISFILPWISLLFCGFSLRWKNLDCFCKRFIIPILIVSVHAYLRWIWFLSSFFYFLFLKTYRIRGYRNQMWFDKYVVAKLNKQCLLFRFSMLLERFKLNMESSKKDSLINLCLFINATKYEIEHYKTTSFQIHFFYHHILRIWKGVTWPYQFSLLYYQSSFLKCFFVQ